MGPGDPILSLTEVNRLIGLFIKTQAGIVGLEAFQTFFGLIPSPDHYLPPAFGFEIWNRLPADQRAHWDEVTAAVLDDFDVWLSDPHHWEDLLVGGLEDTETSL